MGQGKELDWAHVQPDALALYHGQKHDKEFSLAKVMKAIEDRHGFRASVRSWRTKLKQWREAGLMNDVQPVTISSCDGRPIHDDNVFRPVLRPMIHDYASLSHAHIDNNRSTLDSSVVDDVEQKNQSPARRNAESSPKGVPHTRTARKSRLDDLYTLLSSSADTSAVRRRLDQEVFEEGQDSILHYCSTKICYDLESESTSQRTASELGQILEYMQSRGLDIDMRGARGRTAMELAILSNIAPNVQLLLNFGASTTATDEDGDQPLHMATRYTPSGQVSSTIISMLLEHGAGVCIINNMDESPLQLLIEHLRKLSLDKFQRSSRSYVKMCKDIKKLLDLAPSGDLQHDTDAFWSMATFLKTIVGQCTTSVIQPALECLQCFLAKGCNPLLEAFDKSLRCCDHSCKNVVAFAAFHDASGNAWKTIIDNIDLRIYGDWVARELLKLCPCRVRDSDPASYLRPLLEHDFIFLDSSLRVAALHDLVSSPHSHDKLTIIRTVLERRGDIDIHARGQSLQAAVEPSKSCRLIEQLVRAAQWHNENHPDWDVVEALLSRDLQSASVRASTSLNQDQLFIYGDDDLRYLSAVYHRHLQRYLDGASTNVVGTVHVCILHVLTKRMVETSASLHDVGKRIIRLQHALQIRDECGLPSIAVDQQILLGCINAGPSYLQEAPELGEKIRWLRHEIGVAQEAAEMTPPPLHSTGTMTYTESYPSLLADDSAYGQNAAGDRLGKRKRSEEVIFNATGPRQRSIDGGPRLR